MKKTSQKRREIYLPQNEKEFDQLVHTLCKKYKLPNAEHAAAVVANRIQHLGPDQATSTLEYFGHCILKNIAYQVAEHRSKTIQHKMSIDQLMTLLKNNPNDQQAVDALEQAVNQGSQYAKEQLAKIRPEKPLLKAVNTEPESA